METNLTNGRNLTVGSKTWTGWRTVRRTRAMSYGGSNRRICWTGESSWRTMRSSSRIGRRKSTGNCVMMRMPIGGIKRRLWLLTLGRRMMIWIRIWKLIFIMWHYQEGNRLQTSWHSSRKMNRHCSRNCCVMRSYASWRSRTMMQSLLNKTMQWNRGSWLIHTWIRCSIWRSSKTRRLLRRPSRWKRTRI